MSNKRKSTNFIQSLILVTVMVLSAIALPFAYETAALAADNYNAAMDGYQETRNPNRVKSSEEEIKNSEIYQTEETAENSIYEELVEKVNKEKETAAKKMAKEQSLAN